MTTPKDGRRTCQSHTPAGRRSTARSRRTSPLKPHKPLSASTHATWGPPSPLSFPFPLPLHSPFRPPSLPLSPFHPPPSPLLSVPLPSPSPPSAPSPLASQSPFVLRAADRCVVRWNLVNLFSRHETALSTRKDYGLSYSNILCSRCTTSATIILLSASICGS